MRDIEKIIIHCSASDNPDQDNIQAIKHLHTSSKETKIKWGKYQTTGKGFIDVGYHYFIDRAGILSVGRPIEKIGAHCRGHNHDSIGICLSGAAHPTPSQLNTCMLLCEILVEAHDLEIEDIFPHNFFDRRKTCPNFKIELLHKKIRSRLEDLEIFPPKLQ